MLAHFPAANHLLLMFPSFVFDSPLWSRTRRNMDVIMRHWLFEQYNSALEVYMRLAEMVAERLRWSTLLAGSAIATATSAAPSGFPVSGNGLWYRTPGTIWSKEWLPVGNGYLAAMTPGGTTFETTQLNIESLWSGGPFQDPTYNGGNKQPSQRAQMATDMQNIRQTIFTNGTIDNVEVLSTDPGAYGSYSGAGYLLTSLNSTSHSSNYTRWLDLDAAVARASWSSGNGTLIRTSFCSHPLQACIQHLSSAPSSTIPTITHAFSAALEDGLPTPTVTCLDNSTLQVEGLVSDPGMAYELLFRASAVGNSSRVACVPSGTGNATLTITGATEAWVTWVGDTEYNMNAGDAAHNFTFRQELPHDKLVSLLETASPSSQTPSSSTYASLLAQHTAAYTSILGPFALSLGQKPDLTSSTDELKAAYQTNIGNSYLEWLLFNFGRYLLASSAPGVLPANLQGKWADGSSNSWGSDYHSNINLQMNYWFAEMTGMSSVVVPLFNYIENTWAPRGAYTAEVLYNINQGWVTHDEMNVFGHTGMKLSGNSAEWADYPESAVWMMVHVWDHFDFSGDSQWWKSQGWPLLKGVAQFHISKLIPDEHFNDSTLVVAPCNSPEQVPITLGCAHAQQLIWQLFNAVEKGYAASGDNDEAFLSAVLSQRAQMDKGIHIGSWGQLQEWKIDMDSPNDTHRHLSHLVGLYPGYALASYNSSIQAPPHGTAYTKAEVLNATQTSLIHRGNGTGPDADSGWEKVWRAAAWAQFANSSTFYEELSYAVERNFAPSLFSMYDPFDADPIFQIDANFGYPAALLNALIQAPDVASLTSPLIVTLLPALPTTWPTGSIESARIRGGMSLDMAWADGKLTSAAISVNSSSGAVERSVEVVYQGKTVASFTASPGANFTIP
ncbi:glycoside hydrolase family 95 protein [Phanerochaete carnosa HHB-10118-sp]|uniref:Glycoside hydrolase family 95 protein n=1 Tax=Phanerochaete carnosa (strain HHB-10118-sp) TaxID=650164 RepID=K5W2Q0_PHACS|nr:glycoside hydrolase family 95 protein [Phanerochaete carnosa HHB-10118-sp]EKM53204.1 glycoside hydrolase family 95 protein [Phanerochaete carnosa HHB-10118-sp]